jgi:hypothetical protein
MAIPRKRALGRLESFLLRVDEHLALIAKEPDHISVNHWKYEVRNWLNQMEAMLPHVGNKTAAEWQPRIARLHQALEQ